MLLLASSHFGRHQAFAAPAAARHQCSLLLQVLPKPSVTCARLLHASLHCDGNSGLGFLQ